MKKLGLIIIISITALLSACSSPAQDEILNYLNEELPGIGEMEAEVINKYDSVTGDNYTDDETLYNALNEEIIPLYSDFIDELESIEIKDKDLRAIHEGYIEAVNQQSGAFNKMITALENQDAALIEEVNEILNQSRKAMRDYQYDLQEFADENDVEITKE